MDGMKPVEAYLHWLLLLFKVGGTKSVRDCVHFYYMWKLVCVNDYKRLRLLRRKREQDELYNLRSQALFETTSFEHQPATAALPSVESKLADEMSGGILLAKKQLKPTDKVRVFYWI